MNNEIATTQRASLAERRTALAVKAAEIEEIANGALVHFQNAGSMADELAVAQAIVDLRKALTPEVMAPIMALMNTDLGFRTDRDPAQKDKNTGLPYIPYSVDVVRDVVIEAKLRGFRCVGNELNIIAHRFYAAQNGFFRKLTDIKSFPGLSGFRDSYGLPKITTQGATVVAKAQWTLNGKQDSYEQEFGIKVNAMMGADAIIGKARRKLCKRVHDILLGINTPEGEVGDVDVDNLQRVSSQPSEAPKMDDADDDHPPGLEPATVAPVAEVAKPDPAPAPAPAPRPKARVAKQTEETKPTPPPQEPADPTPAVQVALPAQEAAMEPPAVRVMPSERLANVVTGAGFTFDQFKACPGVAEWFDGKAGRPDGTMIDGFDMIPNRISSSLLGKDGNGEAVVNTMRREFGLPANQPGLPIA
jgi:hypothetical protein